MKKILSIVLCLFVLLSVAACGKTNEAAAALEKDLAALKSGAFADTEILQGSAFANEEDMMLDAMFARFSYKIGESKIDGDTATVAVTMTMVDMGEAFSAYMSAAMEHLDEANWDADGSYFAEMIKGEDVATTDFSVTVNMEKNADGVWAVAKEGNEALYNALTGGLLDSLSGLGA